MKIIKNAIVKLLQWASNGSNDVYKEDTVKPAYGPTLGSGRYGPDIQGMHFTVFNAVGGKIIQISQYNPINDRHKQQLYIVTDKEDLGNELGQIITMESLGK